MEIIKHFCIIRRNCTMIARKEDIFDPVKEQCTFQSHSVFLGRIRFCELILDFDEN